MNSARKAGHMEMRMAEIEDAIVRGAQARGAELSSSHFRWNRGHPLEGRPDPIAMRIDFGAYRCFEVNLTYDQLENGLGDPTVAAYVAAAITQIAGGREP